MMEILKTSDRRGKGGRKRITDAQKDKVVQMYKAGLTVAQIRSTVGIARSTVYAILKERTVEAVE